MSTIAGDEIGYAWLAARYNVQATQPLPVESRIGRRRQTYDQAGRRLEYYTEAMRPQSTLGAHLTFALKHEGVVLEFLARLFVALPAQALAEWIRSEPTGQYARRAGFLYEWLTSNTLKVEGVGGNYRHALDPQLYVTAATGVRRNRRWRINDNLPGTPEFCPLVRRTPLLAEARQYAIADRLAAMEGEFGPDIVRRSAVWLTIKESRASFVIEHEGQHQDRIRRFATAMEQYCGRLDSPLDERALSEFQSAILGTTTIRTGLRQSPVFVGSNSIDYGAIVHYVCPHWEWLPGMLDGLQCFLARTEPGEALVRAAVASFGFVFIHPLADGNGRISRFLVNDTLRRDGVVPEPFILPISAAITSSAVRRAEYDRILERYSRPLMSAYRDAVDFTHERVAYADGIESDFAFNAYDEAASVWRYPDLTEQAEYLFAIIGHTLEHEMHHQAAFQRAWYRTREAIKDWVEGPDEHIDRMIRAIRQHGRVSGKLMKEFPVLAQAGLASEIEQAVAEGFADLPDVQ
ncbi:Fic family protein [Marinobacter sp. ATCH36]|uniref:Fic family protein n=1 Tax=Marinobacter sp. ATCH36 TaxID=2945106 RepID=UPI0020205177|nr:Fic family protein [Marinobacter sp. ATCH36]MCL7945127.1 Fic family protein [Marinobacter sp. ATCH36]